MHADRNASKQQAKPSPKLHGGGGGSGGGGQSHASLTIVEIG